MARMIFLSEQAIGSLSITSRVEAQFSAKIMGFDAKEVVSATERLHIQLIVVYIHELSEQSETELFRILSFVKNIPFVLVGTRDVCRPYYGKTEAIIKKYIFTPITLTDFSVQLQAVVNEIDGIAPALTDDVASRPVVKVPHILVVDDDPVYLRTMMNWLRDVYRISVVKGGKAALAFLATEIPDLILLDYEMPDLNGVGTLRQIRSEEKFQNIPVVFLTGVSDSDSVKEAVKLKPQGYVLKSIKQPELLEKIHDVLKMQ